MDEPDAMDLPRLVYRSIRIASDQNHFQDSPFSQDDRNQLFLTVGAFRRVDYGLQGGLVIDYLKERWYYRSSLTQLRGELSFRTLAGSEFGFAFATGIEDKEIQETFDSGVPTTLSTNISPIDTFDSSIVFIHLDPNEAPS